MGLPTESYLSHQSYFGAQQQALASQQAMNLQNQVGQITEYRGNKLKISIEEGTKIIKPEGVSIMNSFKAYLAEHRNLIYALILVFLADHYVLGGAFREKIKAVVEKLLDKAHQKIGE